MFGELVEQLPPWLQLMVGPQTILFPIAGTFVLLALVIHFAEDIEAAFKKWRNVRKRKRDIKRLYR